MSRIPNTGCARNILTVHRETLTQYITFKREGRGESVLLYTLYLATATSYIDPSLWIVTKFPKVEPLRYLYSPSLWVVPYAGVRIRIRIVSGSWIRIRIRIRVKSWIWIRLEVKIQELSRLKMEPWRAVVAQNGGVDDQSGGLEGL